MESTTIFQENTASEIMPIASSFEYFTLYLDICILIHQQSPLFDFLPKDHLVQHAFFSPCVRT